MRGTLRGRPKGPRRLALAGGTGPANSSPPRWEGPRSVAEWSAPLETKFLLFWAGQERDSVLLRSPAPRSDCSGLHERNLPVATLWPSPTSGTLGGRRFRAEKGGGGKGWRRDGPLESKEGSDQAGARHGPLDRWKDQSKLAHGMVRWGRWKDQTALSLALVSCSGALTPSGSQEFKGRPRDNKTIGSVQPNSVFLGR